MFKFYQEELFFIIIQLKNYHNYHQSAYADADKYDQQ